MAYPEPVQKFLTAVIRHVGAVRTNLDETRGGHWWIDLHGRRHLAVEWRPDRGFGLTENKSPQYGEGPSEVFSSPERAARRVAQLLGPKSGAVGGLAGVRELYDMTQTQLGKKLSKGQPAISQIEKGRDLKLETIDSFIRGLGGQMEVRAVFRDASLAIPLSQLGGAKHATAKLARAARA